MYKNKSRIYLEVIYLKSKIEMKIMEWMFNLLFVIKNKKRPTLLSKKRLNALKKHLKKE